MIQRTVTAGRACALLAALFLCTRAAADDIALTADVGLPEGAYGWRIVGYGDFNGDGHRDLAWRRWDDTGEVRIWLLDGSRLLADIGLPNGAPGWHVVGVGDFDGDGKSDLVWRRTNETLEARIWFLNGTANTVSLRADVGLPIGGPGWHIIGTGDFNGDGRCDLVWRRTNETGEVRLWFMNGSRLLQDVGLPEGAYGWRIVGYGDFNGDGHLDLAWRRWDEKGEVRVWLLDGARLLADLGLPTIAPGWHVVGVGDFDGDGRSDLVWRRTTETLEARIWLLDGGRVRQDLGLPLGDGGWHVIGVGEFNGDGRADLVWRRTNETGEVRLWFLKRVTDLAPLHLDVPLRAQQTEKWCWAASTDMVLNYYGNSVAQCVQANARLNRKDCCSIPMCSNPYAPHPCNAVGAPEFWRWGYKSKVTPSGTPLSVGNLASEFAANRPVVFGWGWTGGGGHFMVARGLYFGPSGRAWIEYLDPGAPCVGTVPLPMLYDEWVQAAGHVHWSDYSQVVPNTVASLFGTFIGDASSTPAAGGPLKIATPPIAVAPAGPLVHLDDRPAPRGHATPHEAAFTAIRDVHAAARGRVPGLSDDAAIAAARPGEALAQYFVRLDELSTFQPGGNPENLLHDTDRVFVPMLVGGAVRNGAIAAKRDGGYTVVTFESEHFAKRVAERIAGAPRTALTGPRFLVRVPALRREFVAWRELGFLMFLPLDDDLRLGFNRSVPMPAADALARLAPVARAEVMAAPQ